jgi:hypothetical protein
MSWGEAIFLGTIVASFVMMELLFLGSLRDKNKKDKDNE